MKKVNLLKLMLISLSIAAVTFSCDDDDDTRPKGEYSDGVFITNEGNFSSGNGSVSFYSFKEDTVYNNIFTLINDRPLGSVVQSLTVFNDKAYIVVNASNKIEVVDAGSFIENATITDLSNPRYFIGIDKYKAYVTQWGNDGEIKVIDLQQNQVSKTIDVGYGPEKMYQFGNYIFVANGGGFGKDSTVMVINSDTDAIIDTLKLGHNPKDMVIDKDQNLWVLCYGHIEYDLSWNIVFESPSELYKINLATFNVLKKYTISATTHPEHLEISPDGTTIYYGAGFSFGHIYKMGIYDNALPTEPFSDKYFYGFNVVTKTAEIFALEAPSFTTNGTMYRYNSAGTELGTYEVGVAPNGTGLKKK
ncbi:MAG: hypothetical protein A2W99_05225 [Bacteroidetes bacterium GWF2_33_16]|nr:MAG: hypothetical protein A2X00_17745 [Bacteroidetes bacterium GWE2_32_14]OFY06063.1 MAG: hypothetical protein A2W99_05225 [Bacteroidetes bacterium GWF2_33_16]